MVEPKLATDTEGLSAGRLEGISLPDLIWMLRAGRKTGVLTVQRRGIEKSVYFDQGTIVFAASTDPDDRLGELLLRQGTISLDQLEAALANLHRGKRLGTLLVEAGSMGADKLVSAVLTQVQMIVLDLFTWEEGEYRFEEGTLPTDEVITLNMKTNEILRSGIRRIRSFGRTRRSVGPPRTIYGLADDWKDEIDGQSLSEPEQLLIAALEQSDRSIEQLCREVLLSNFEIYETLWVLKVQGVVTERRDQITGSGDASHQGSLESEGFVQVMVRLCREGQTGVLYVRRRSQERSFHFRQGCCVFATSSNSDDGLVAFLLMRGVISLRDRQETDKRLLSNKRVGTILRELGVIDDRDLGVMVRQQLSEIVYDTFRFADGDFSFVAGDLPSTEEITLEATVESLVLEGLRRVTSWSRVKRGCGGMDTQLELTPEYMDVLDAMGAGAGEWQVITALKAGRTPRDVCREAKLDDFRTCRTLWALRALGAVRAAGVVEVDDSQARSGEAPGDCVEPALPADESTEAPQQVPVVAEEGTLEEIDVEPQVELSPQQTQLISREAVHAALGGVDPASEPDQPQIDATQAIPRQTVEAALGGDQQEEVAEEPSVATTGDDEEVAPTEPEPDPTRELDSRERTGDGTNIWDLEESTRTMQLPREEVDAALVEMRSAEADDADADRPVALSSESEPSSECWELPGGLEAIIEQFNAMQRVVYRAIRAEVGAGAANFIRSCCDTTAASIDPLKGAELQSDGSWDTEGLKRAVTEHRISDPRLVYEELIDREIDLLRAHIGDARVLELERQIERVEQATANNR